MATKPKAATQVATIEQNTEVALPEDWQTALADEAKDDTAVEQTDMQAFSLRAGVLSYNDQPMPNNTMRCIVVASAFEKAMFISKFDPNNITPPLCFALAPDGDKMVPHENSYVKQGPNDTDDKGKEIAGTEKCTGCAQLEWGSDPNSPSGRGKMCKETRRLGIIPEDALTDGVAKSRAAMLRIPVTSVANWSSYVHLVAATLKRPVWSVVTEIKVEPDPKKQFQVLFSVVDKVQDTNILAELQPMRERVQKSVMNPYALMTEGQYKVIMAPPPPPPSGAKAKKKF